MPVMLSSWWNICLQNMGMFTVDIYLCVSSDLYKYVTVSHNLY